MQAEYVKRLKEAENSDSEQGSFKRLKSDNGNGMAVPDDVAAFSEEAADWLLLNPGEWAEKLVPCVRSSEYHARKHPFHGGAVVSFVCVSCMVVVCRQT